MKVFTLGDLHLSHQVEKPMDVFGGHWQNHSEKIKENWHSVVEKEDVIIMPGDFSWATYLEQAEEDFKFLDRLPGRKIMLKGNHDYWWETITKMRKFLGSIGVESVDFLYNNSYQFNGKCYCGTKGWDAREEKDEKIINRETIRLKLSLDSAKCDDGDIIAVFHYPPDDNPLLQSILEEYGVKKCIYGHKHGFSEEPKRYVSKGVEYINASADQVGFIPIEI